MDNPSQLTRTPTRVADSPPAFSTDTSTVIGAKSAAATTTAIAMAAMDNHTGLCRRLYRPGCLDRANDCVTNLVDNRRRRPNGLDADVAGLVDDD